MTAAQPLVRTNPRVGSTVVAPIGFLGAYLAVDPVAGALADRPLPLPGSPPAEVVGYVAANPVAIGATSILQVVSVVCLAVFVAALAPALRSLGRSWISWAGFAATAAMVASSVLSVTLATIVSSVGEATVVGIRQASFYAGGVATVVLTGVFVAGAAQVLGRDRLFGAGVRWFGLVAGGIAVASVASLAFYYANAALPVGRLLCMVWALVAGIAVYRRLRVESR